MKIRKITNNTEKDLRVVIVGDELIIKDPDFTDYTHINSYETWVLNK